jgi:hypothetical protein
VAAGGTPYTPFDSPRSIAAGRGIYDLTQVNGARNPAYQSLNLRIDRRFHFKRSNLSMYVEVWNLFDRKNVAYRDWNRTEKRPEIFAQLGRLPILGAEYEF